MGDLAWNKGNLFVGHSSDAYAWVFSIPDTGIGNKNLLYEGQVRGWWLEDDRLIYAQNYDLFSMPQTGGPPSSILHYGDLAYDVLNGLSLSGHNLDRTAIYWLFYSTELTVRRHLRSGGEDTILAKLFDFGSRELQWMRQAKDQLVINFWTQGFGTYVATVPKAGGTPQPLPVPAGNSRVLAVSNSGTLLWYTPSDASNGYQQPYYSLGSIDSSDVLPFPIALPQCPICGPLNAWSAGSGAWYIAISEFSAAQGALYLSVWYVKSDGQASRLACDPTVEISSSGAEPLLEGTSTAGVTIDGGFFLSVSYPKGNWLVARIKNPGATADSFSTDDTNDGGVSGSDSMPDSVGSCPVVTGSAQAEGKNVFTEFPLPSDSRPHSIIGGPDGNLWFGENASNIGRITTTGCVTEYPLNDYVYGLVGGPDGNIWFTQPRANQIARIATDGMSFRPFGSRPVSSPEDIALGQDGNFWFTDYLDSMVGRMTPEGVITPFTPPSKLSMPSLMVVGSDGLLWFSEIDRHQLCSINPTTEVMTEVTIPNGGAAHAMTLGPDGAIWFANHRSEATSITRLNADGSLTDFPFTTGKFPTAMTRGPDGNLWLAVSDTSYIARFSPISGDVTEFPIPTPASYPAGITTGPDGNIWFTEEDVSQIGRFTP